VEEVINWRTKSYSVAQQTQFSKACKRSLFTTKQCFSLYIRRDTGMYNCPWVITWLFIETSWSKNNVVRILSRLRTGRPQNHVRIPAGPRDFSSQRPGWLWVQTGRPGGTLLAVKRPECDAALSLSSNCEIKVAYSYPSTPPLTFMAYTGETLLLLRRFWDVFKDQWDHWHNWVWTSVSKFAKFNHLCDCRRHRTLG
jgi:hypothetical protein